ncbi:MULTISPECIES: DUF397 domain-containing protein [unclassified Streptomyces]|uniref:DUF397 domain-containing protein n=1 Tax=unclassified Streptomyces TaxID=2593676 RepID=UPI00382E34FF
MSTQALKWFKSTRSGSEGGACLEVAVSWKKSSYSSSEGGACVEVASCPGSLHIRDSKQPAAHAPALHVTPAAWVAFTDFLK